jgi:hypothetical protein
VALRAQQLLEVSLLADMRAVVARALSGLDMFSSADGGKQPSPTAAGAGATPFTATAAAAAAGGVALAHAHDLKASRWPGWRSQGLKASCAASWLKEPAGGCGSFW